MVSGFLASAGEAEPALAPVKASWGAGIQHLKPKSGESAWRKPVEPQRTAELWGMQLGVHGKGDASSSG